MEQSNTGRSIYLIMNCPVSPNSMGGGDKIMLENAKVWQKMGFKLLLLGCEEALGMCQQNSLQADLYTISRFPVAKFGMLGAYILRILKSVFSSVKVASGQIIYCASDFLPDTLPAFKAKIFGKNIKWVVGFYLRVRNPFLHEVSFSFRNIIFFIQQQVSIYLMRFGNVDGIFVLSAEDVEYLVSKGFPKNKILLTSGGVSLSMIDSVVEVEKEFDLCFVGKFQDQKGIPELIEIWKNIKKAKEDSKLAIVGWGITHWVDFIESSIKENNWEGCVKLFGFLDGAEKFKVLKKSRVFVFPSTYESWGVVTVEALAAGLPVVAFSLPQVQRNLNSGATFVPLGDTKSFSESVLNLLYDHNIYEKMKHDGRKLAENFDWQNIGLASGNYLKCLN